MPFQQALQVALPYAIEGDWASANPRRSMLAFDGALIAGPNVLAGRFAWADQYGVVNVGGNGRLGFVHKDQISLITTWLGESTMQVMPGTECVLYDGADVWARFANGAAIGQKVFAAYADGSASAGAAGAAPTGSSSTAFTITAQTFSVTAGLAAGVLTVSAVTSGNVMPGSIIASAGTPAGRQIVSQLLPLAGGEALGGIGRYQLASDDGGIIPAGSTVTGSYGLFTPAPTITGTFKIGNVLSGTGISNIFITADASNGKALTGAGGAGTYAVSPSLAASTGTIVAATSIETPWWVETACLPGELAKISVR